MNVVNDSQCVKRELIYVYLVLYIIQVSHVHVVDTFCNMFLCVCFVDRSICNEHKAANRRSHSGLSKGQKRF